MTLLLRPAILRSTTALILLGAAARPAAAASFDVPVTHATLQAAVAAAAASPDVDNVITISTSPVVTNSTITLGAAFSTARRLVIRPAANLPRASVVNQNPTVPIIEMTMAGFVTFQDLDILRNVTNGDHLVMMSTCEAILVERCRIGSHATTTGTAGWANVYMLYPTGIVLRNNILFANSPGTFDRGIDAGSFNDQTNSLRLYNNVISDYREYGIRIEAAAPGALVLLRNNVVANQSALVPEPFAYRTDVLAGPVVIASHNVAFSGAAFVQSGAGQDVAGVASQFINLAKGDVVPSFDTVDWDMAFDANPDYYRLLDEGPLHDDGGDNGMTVTTAGSDIAVTDDIEKEIRPGGVIPHTDRGADQLEPGTSNTAVGPASSPGGLRVTTLRNPGRSLSIGYATRSAGRLELAVFDPAGRIVHRDTQVVGAEAHGTFTWTAASRSEVLIYRVRLTRSDGGREQALGRIALMR